jgi:hypothetical protein
MVMMNKAKILQMVSLMNESVFIIIVIIIGCFVLFAFIIIIAKIIITFMLIRNVVFIVIVIIIFSFNVFIICLSKILTHHHLEGIYVFLYISSQLHFYNLMEYSSKRK